MNDHSGKSQDVIRKYLLGSLDDKVKMRQIEENLLLDDNFAEQLAVAEEELVDDYLDGTLSESDRERFLRFFLISPENKEKLRLIQNLRKYAANRSDVQDVKQFSKEKSGFDWRKFFSSPALRFAAIILLVFGLGFCIWRIGFYQSDVDRGLAQLRLAYRGQRPTQSRTTAGFEYAPIIETRGSSNTPVDEKAQKRAEIFLSEAAENSANAEAHHGLGLLYLAQKEYEKALAEFNLAVKLTPNNAEIHSDLGAALLELGKKAASENNGSKSLEHLDQSLKHIEKAIELNPKLPEPRFNRALCLQALFSSEQAKQAWREYLQIDPNSPWAEEARRNLQALEAQKPQERSATDLERDFLNAWREKNDEKAWQLLSQNRELIREKYLPQRLSISYITAAVGEKESFLQALRYSGELERQRNRDSFAADIANFYAMLPESKIESIKQAQTAVQNGYRLLLGQNYIDALTEFNTARDLFNKIGDVWESKLSEYFIGYCLINSDRTKDSLAQLQQVAEFARIHNYKWLEATTLHWVAGGLRVLKQRWRSKKSYEKALALAEEIDDSYAVQRNLTELARHSSFVGQKQTALNYLRRILEESAKAEISLRQKYRNYDDASKNLTAAKLYYAAKPIAVEAVQIADQTGDRMFQTLARSNAGLAYGQTGDYVAARKWLNDGKEKAAAIDNEPSRKKMLAYFSLKSGLLERQAGNYEISEQFYDEAARSYETIEVPSNLYEAQKGKLHALLALGKNAELEQQIPATLKLVEDYREKILEERERTSFFEAEESIYDIAVEYEFENNRYEQAYNYAETSNARSLLDWLQKGLKTQDKEKKREILLNEAAAPLTLSEIRRQMPDQVQILQYTVLENRLIIWLVSKEKFIAVPVKIKSTELRARVENYIKSLNSPNGTAVNDARQLGRELYDLLITPVLDHLDSNREICLIPNDILFYLPFAALIAPDEKPFLANFRIFYAPSANIFLLSTEYARQKEATTKEKLLSIGNPAFDRREFDDLPDLPTAKEEARTIAALYDSSQIFTDSNATKTVLQSSIKDADVIHFAGHYVVVHDEPLSSYMLLASSGREPENSILTNAELTGETLPRAKLVVLSGCQTGVEHYYNGEGMVGLSRTFLAAGSPLVVASLWSVETGATAELMKRFHFHRRQGKMPTAEALRAAQLEMVNDTDVRFRHPYYWAAFSVFGGFTTF